VPQSKSGCGGKEKQFRCCPCRELNPDHPAHSLIPTFTELTDSFAETYLANSPCK